MIKLIKIQLCCVIQYDTLQPKINVEDVIRINTIGCDQNFILTAFEKNWASYYLKGNNMLWVTLLMIKLLNIHPKSKLEWIQPANSPLYVVMMLHWLKGQWFTRVAMVATEIQHLLTIMIHKSRHQERRHMIQQTCSEVTPTPRGVIFLHS